MTGQADYTSPELRDRAAEWVVRLSADAVDETDWLAFRAWLDEGGSTEGERRRAAFDHAQSMWFALDEARATVVKRTPHRRARQPTQALSWGLGGLAAAACVAVLVAVSLNHVAPPSPAAAATAYEAGIGERKTVQLADGTRIYMNSGSRLAVTYTGRLRRVTMDEAEADFDVVHDASRPFVIQVGDSEVRVLGTAFDVRHYGGDTQISVSRGVVQMSTASGVVRLARGMAASHPDGGPIEVSARDPQAALAWRDGRLLYLDQPLSRVVDDLNRQFPRPIRLADAQTSNLRFTGVIVVGSQEDTLRRLTALLPLRSRIVGRTVVLSSRGP